MPQDTTTALLACEGGSYTAQSSGPFNERAPVVGSFAAFCAFVINGEYQSFTVDEDSPPATRWLWGNFDNNTGWSLTLQSSVAGQGQLVAAVATPGGVLRAAVDITGPNLVSPIERKLFVGLWYIGLVSNGIVSTGLLTLSINGSIVSTVIGAGATQSGYVPSARPARLGADPATGVITSAAVEFISCGYAPLTIIPSVPSGTGEIGVLAANSWRAFNEGSNQNFVAQDAGFDWLHRYNVATLGYGLSADVKKSTAGAYVDLSPGTGYASTPAALADIGNLSPNSMFASAATPSNLIRAGVPKLLSAKNIPDYGSLAPEFTGLAPLQLIYEWEVPLAPSPFIVLTGSRIDRIVERNLTGLDLRQVAPSPAQDVNYNATGGPLNGPRATCITLQSLMHNATGTIAPAGNRYAWYVVSRVGAFADVGNARIPLAPGPIGGGGVVFIGDRAAGLDVWRVNAQFTGGTQGFNITTPAFNNGWNLHSFVPAVTGAFCAVNNDVAVPNFTGNDTMVGFNGVRIGFLGFSGGDVAWIGVTLATRAQFNAVRAYISAKYQLFQYP